jgi:AraC-like DNA-binding protein
MFCSFDIYNTVLTEQHRQINKDGHSGQSYHLNSPDGINFGYYKVLSAQQGSVTINNLHPFIQLSYTVSGRKWYVDNNGPIATFGNYEYNYLYLDQQEIQLQWQAGEPLEIFELAISPETFLQYLPEDHPLYTRFFSSDLSRPLSPANLPLSQVFSSMLYQILRCPLEGRYKRLYVKSKIIELLAYQLEQFEQLSAVSTQPALRKEEIDRMHQVRDIIMSNLDSPCSLIDLAHQVGTNETYLKKHFKLVFNNTVFGYMQNEKLAIAREELLQGKPVQQVADRAGYKHAAHFARAFKKHFGYPPTAIKK